MIRLQTLLALALTLTLAGTNAWATDYDLYLLSGQSNMDGFGKVNELDPAECTPVEGVMIFHGNPAPDGDAKGGLGLWAPLKPGHGWGFRSDGKANKYSGMFGPEIFFARTMRAANPDRKIALIKYSRGGTSIHQDVARQFGCWEPDYNKGEGPAKGINQYDHFLKTLNTALAVRDIDGDGSEDRLIPAGILWMQGESDAQLVKEVAEAYGANLKRLMDLMRAAVRTDDLPVVIGRISDSGQDGDGKVWDYGDIVRTAQAEFVKKDGHAALVTSTDNYKYSDKWHYDTAGFIDLGKQFAVQMQSIQKPAE
jgi:hypothetical protein